MADDNNYLEYLIALRLEMLGTGDVSKALDEIRKKHGDLLKDAKRLKDAFGSIGAGVGAIADEYSKSAKEAKGFKKVIIDLDKSIRTQATSITNMSAAVVSFLGVFTSLASKSVNYQ